jgi:hypothetical protein
LIFGTLLCHTKIQIKIEFSFDPYIFSRRYGPWTYITNYQFPALFLSLLTDIHLIFGTLFCHTKLQIKFKFGFDPLEFHEVVVHELRKISRIVSFLHFCNPPYWFCSLR